MCMHAGGPGTSLDFGQFQTIDKLTRQLRAWSLPPQLIQYVVEVYEEKSISTLTFQGTYYVHVS